MIHSPSPTDWLATGVSGGQAEPAFGQGDQAAQRRVQGAAAANGRAVRGGAVRGRGAVRSAGQVGQGLRHGHRGHGLAHLRLQRPPTPPHLQRGQEGSTCFLPLGPL